MSEFQKGDRVRWKHGPGQPVGTVQRGPYSLSLVDGTARHDETYVVLFKPEGGEPYAELLAERVLEPVTRWVDCPGEHRYRPKGREVEWHHLDRYQVQRKVEA